MARSSLVLGDCRRPVHVGRASPRPRCAKVSALDPESPAPMSDVREAPDRGLFEVRASPSSDRFTDWRHRVAGVDEHECADAGGRVSS